MNDYGKNTAIIFDLDGTLWDSRNSAVDIWNRVIEQYTDFSVRLDLELCTKLMGKTGEEITAILFPDCSLEERAKLSNTFGREEVAYLREHGAILYEGVAETLEKLSKDHALFLVSNCQDGYAAAFMYAHHVEEYFTDLEMSGRTGLGKADNIRLIMERNGVTDAVYVGDTVGDETATHEAGIPFIYASYGFGEAACPEGVIGDIRELPDCFGNIER